MSYCVEPPFSFLSEFFVSSPGVIGPSLLAVAPTPPALPQPWPFACDCLQSSTASTSGW